MARRPKVPRKTSQPFSLLVKPAGADCNLACTYCFYLKKQGLYPDRNVHRMSDEVLDRLIAGYMQTEQQVYSFGWQGGEPTLMGVEFFRKVTELQQKYGRPGARVANGLQTNATLITDEFAEHLAAYQFLVGVSLDGPQEVHDTYRRTRGEKPSHHLVMKAVERMRSRKVEVNALVLVSQSNVHRPEEVYNYLRSEGFNFLQFIPCVEFTPAGEPAPFSITGEEWGEFLKRIFALWYPADVRTVSVRHHDSLMQFLLDGSRTMCTMGGRCDAYYVVEHTGDVYPCDFFVQPELRVGNVMDDGWGDLERRPVRSKFAGQKANWSDACVGCKHLAYCSGDCLKHREHAPDGDGSWLCAGWRSFYDEAIPVLRSLAEEVQRERGLHGPLWEPGRSDPEAICYCGSGKKYRNCHGRVNQSTTASATS
jgi:uncharacterized protein